MWALFYTLIETLYIVYNGTMQWIHIEILYRFIEMIMQNIDNSHPGTHVTIELRN